MKCVSSELCELVLIFTWLLFLKNLLPSVTFDSQLFLCIPASVDKVVFDGLLIGFGRATRPIGVPVTTMHVVKAKSLLDGLNI